MVTVRTSLFLHCLNFQFVEDEFLLRNPITHDIHCSKLSGPLSTEDSTTYGINSSCPLNAISHFYVAKSQIPQDVMHVLFEGVLPMETKLMLSGFMEAGYITINILNQRVNNFGYGRVEARNKPPKQFQKSYFTGTGSKLHLSCTSVACLVSNCILFGCVLHVQLLFIFVVFFLLCSFCCVLLLLFSISYSFTNVEFRHIVAPDYRGWDTRGR